MMLISLSAAGQALPKAPAIPPKVYSAKTITIADPSKENPVLVIYNNKRSFAKDTKSVIDTLSTERRYQILTGPDSIKQYSDSKFVREVILIYNP